MARTTTLRGFRRVAMLTLDQVAATVGVTRQTVASWEDGRTLPTGAQVVALARAYRVHAMDILETLTYREV